MGEKGNAELVASAAQGSAGLAGDLASEAAGMAKDVAVATGTAVVTGKVSEKASQDDEDESTSEA